MNDLMLLQINRQRKLIPEERLKAAQEIQDMERAAGRTPRALLDILAMRGDLDSTTVRIIKSLERGGNDAPAGSKNGNGTEETVVDPYRSIVESVVLQAPPSTAQPRAGWPEEVIAAEGEVKNLFGQFVLVAQVGSGGSGTVYRAWDRRVNRYAGVKILHTMEPSALERFTREARIAGNLQHPSIATIYEVGEQDGRCYIAMKYIDGKPIDSEPRSIPECLGLIRDACRALDYAHKQGIIHRDIKPANLLVDSNDHLYVTDFGIAKQTTIEHTSTLSLTGTIIGTPKYLPPEQARGEAKLADARSDVYSIGATLYTLLAGRAPFPSSNVWETLESVMKREPPPLNTLNAAISPELEEIVAKAMSKDPAHRFPSAGELANELDRILQQRRYTGRYGLMRYLARKWMWAAAAGLVIGGIIHVAARTYEPAAPPAPNYVKPTSMEDRYLKLAMRVMKAQEEYQNDQPGDLARYIEGVTKDIQIYLTKNPNHLPSQVLLARADYLLGDLKAMNTRLKDFGTDPRDYRVSYLKGLVALEAWLDSTRAPWMEPESRLPAWLSAHDEPKLDPRQFLVPTTEVPFILDAEADKDRTAGQAVMEFLNAFKSGRGWSRAIHVLATPTMQLPVFRKALHRATYLDRRWAETLAQAQAVHGNAPCRECPGARFAQACEPGHPNPIALLEGLRDECKGEPATEMLILVCLARRSIERGLDSRPFAKAGEALATDPTREFRGILRVAALRWKSLSGSDEESEYEDAASDLSSAPATTMGKLARIEARLLLGERRRIRGGDYRPPLDEAVEWAKAQGNGWPPLRTLRAEAYLRMGRTADALKELPASAGSTVEETRANLISAQAHLQSNNLVEARKHAKLAYDAAHDHPEAIHLLGTVALEEAKAAADPYLKALEATDLFSLALKFEPDHLEARYDRACALFLLADWAPMAESIEVQNRLLALADLDVVLKKIPTLAPAKTLRDLLTALNGSMEVQKGKSK